jgi:RNA polymerase sigma-70 factor, ECF subfamily
LPIVLSDIASLDRQGGIMTALGIEIVERPEHRAAPRSADHGWPLVDALRRREPTSAEHLSEQYGKRAHRLAARITGNVQDAEEVVQDALWKVVRKIDTFRGESAFGSWFYRIVANAAYQKLRRRRVGRELPLDEVRAPGDEDGGHAEPVAAWSPAVDDPSRRTELRAVLSDAMDALAPDYRATIVLHDVQGLSTGQVAETLGLSVANVKTRVHRARVLLRKRLAEHVTTGSGRRFRATGQIRELTAPVTLGS